MPGHGCFTVRNPPWPCGTGLPCSSRIAGLIPGNGTVAEPGLSGVAPGGGVEEDPAGLRLPPRVDARAALAPDHLPIPDPRLRVDGLADGSQQTQGRKVVARRIVLAHLHERADQRR